MAEHPGPQEGRGGSCFFLFSPSKLWGLHHRRCPSFGPLELSQDMCHWSWFPFLAVLKGRGTPTNSDLWGSLMFASCSTHFSKTKRTPFGCVLKSGAPRNSWLDCFWFYFKPTPKRGALKGRQWRTWEPLLNPSAPFGFCNRNYFATERMSRRFNTSGALEDFTEKLRLSSRSCQSVLPLLHLY